MAAAINSVREAIYALFESPCGPLRADKLLREVVVHLMVSCSTAAASALTALERQLLDGYHEVDPVSAIIVAKQEGGKLAYRLKAVRARLRSCGAKRPAACFVSAPKATGRSLRRSAA